MYSTYFDEYQKQFSEWQKQVVDWQKSYVDSWVANMPNGKGDVNFSDSFEKALSFQEELVKSYLDAQEKTTKMMLDAQRKFWDSYFEQLRKKPTPVGMN
jgi:hypothetical protein